MRTLQEVVKKTVKLPTGAEVKRQANLTIELPETNEEAIALVNGDLCKWAAHGLRAHAKIVASNRLLGAAGDKSLKKSLRQFRESLRTMTDVMEMESTEAVAFLLGKKQFAAVKVHFDSVAMGADVIEVNFTLEELPQPRWFGGNEVEEEEEDEEEVEEK